MSYKNFMPVQTSRTREAIEWSISYSFNTNDTVHQRVLLIGDSICNGYYDAIRGRISEYANISFWASSKCVTDKDYFRELDFILSGYEFSFISFNNGLHSIKSDTAEWKNAYISAIMFIREKCPDAKLSLTLCTAVNDVKKNERICELNGIILQTAKELSIPVIDLFTPMNVKDKSAIMSDTFHFKASAIERQADIIAEHIMNRLERTDSIEQPSTETNPSGKLS